LIEGTYNLPFALLTAEQSSPGAVHAHPEKSSPWPANLFKVKPH
jgi:hypothetical protein